MEQQTNFKLGKEYIKAVYWSTHLFNLYAEHIMWNDGLDEAQAGIKIARGNINNLRYADDTTLMADLEAELKSPLMKVKEESEKVGLKLSIQKTKTMASCPIMSWQIDGEMMETVTDFIILGSKITADGDCSHEIKTLAPWKKSYDRPRQNIKKQRHYFTNKGLTSQSYGFSSSQVWMWELDHKESEVAQSCPTLSDPMDCSLPGSSAHGIFQARVLEWDTIAFSKESWVPKNWCFRTVVLEETLESPLDCKIKSVNPKGN